MQKDFKVTLEAVPTNRMFLHQDIFTASDIKLRGKKQKVEVDVSLSGGTFILEVSQQPKKEISAYRYKVTPEALVELALLAYNDNFKDDGKEDTQKGADAQPAVRKSRGGSARKSTLGKKA